MATHNRILGVLTNADYADNMAYDLRDLERVKFDSGYQVGFLRNGASWTPLEYANMVNDFLRFVPGHRASVTKALGYPEITFRVNNIRNALRLARRYGQVSIWDWANEEEVKVNGRR